MPEFWTSVKDALAREGGEEQEILVQGEVVGFKAGEFIRFQCPVALHWDRRGFVEDSWKY